MKLINVMACREIIIILQLLDVSSLFQRLKASDPVLSFRQCERQTFSMRPDRFVHYSITVQYNDVLGQHHIKQTGMKKQRFGLSTNTRCSEVK